MGQGQFQHVLETVKTNRLNEGGGGVGVCKRACTHVCVCVHMRERERDYDTERETSNAIMMHNLFSIAIQYFQFKLFFFWGGGEMQKHW